MLKAATDHDQLITAAFFMEGLHEAGYDDCIKAWDKGCLEMIYELTSYVPFLTQLAATHVAAGEEYPGVFDYEVSSPFGCWFGRYILNVNSDGPTRKRCEEWLTEAVAQFFAQNTLWENEHGNHMHA